MMADSPKMLASERLYFKQQQQNAKTKRNIAQQQNQLQREAANRTYQRNLADLQHQYAVQRSLVPGAYIKRGVGNGGLYQRGLGEFAHQGQAARQKLALQNELQRRGFNLTDTQAEDIYNQAFHNLQKQEQTLEEDLASKILRGNWGS